MSKKFISNFDKEEPELSDEWKEKIREKIRKILDKTKKTNITQNMDVQLNMTAGFDEKDEKVTLKEIIQSNIEVHFSKMSWKKKAKIAVDRINVQGEQYQCEIVGEYIKNYKESYASSIAFLFIKG